MLPLQRQFMKWGVGGWGVVMAQFSAQLNSINHLMAAIISPLPRWYFTSSLFISRQLQESQQCHHEEQTHVHLKPPTETWRWTPPQTPVNMSSVDHLRESWGHVENVAKARTPKCRRTRKKIKSLAITLQLWKGNTNVSQHIRNNAFFHQYILWAINKIQRLTVPLWLQNL